MRMQIIFSDIFNYKSWEKKINARMGYPRTGRRASDGKLMPDNAKTERYAIPVLNPKNKTEIMAEVDDSDFTYGEKVGVCRT